jgi:hypothetical protein
MQHYDSNALGNTPFRRDPGSTAGVASFGKEKLRMGGIKAATIGYALRSSWHLFLIEFVKMLNKTDRLSQRTKRAMGS